jgi:DNA polymerase I
VKLAAAPRVSVARTEYGDFEYDELGRTIWWGTDEQPLLGPPHQTAGGVWVVCDRDQLALLAAALDEVGQAGLNVGLDTEFDGTNFEEDESIVGKGHAVCVQFAWADETLGGHPMIPGQWLARRAFLPNWGTAEYEGWLGELSWWFASPDHGKVGSYIFNTELHLARNHGLMLDGIRGCNVRQSQQLRNGMVYQHGLKPLGTDLLGYEMRDFEQVFSVPKLKKDGNPYAGDKRVKIPLAEVVTNVGSRMYNDLFDYASLDSKVSCEADAYLMGELGKMVWRKADDVSLTMADFYEREWNPYQYLVAGMEDAGFPIDTDWFEEQRKQAERDLKEATERLDQWASGSTVKWSSNPQKQHFVYGTGTKVIAGNEITGKGLPVSPVCKDGPTLRWDRQKQEEVQSLSCDGVAFQWVKDHCRAKADKAGMGDMLAYTKIDKALSAFLRPIPLRISRYGMLHARIGPETKTGRLTVSKPPLQTLPKPEGDAYHIREGMVAQPMEWNREVARRLHAWAYTYAGEPVPDETEDEDYLDDNMVLVVLDYSQLEMRILAHYLAVLFDDYDLARDLAGGDLHSNTAIRVWGSDPLLQGVTADQIKKHANPLVQAFRNKGKIINFSVNYGKTEVGLGMDIRDEYGEPIGPERARVILEQYFSAYPAIREYHKWAKRYVRTHGYVRMLDGRYRYIPSIHFSSRASQNEAERAALNTPIQGSAAGIMMKAMLKSNSLPIKSLRRMGYFDEALYDMRARLVLQVHDELIWRCPARYAKEVLARVTYHMERPFGTAANDNIVGFPSPRAGREGLPLPVDGGWAATYLAAK